MCRTNIIFGIRINSLALFFTKQHLYLLFRSMSDLGVNTLKTQHGGHSIVYHNKQYKCLNCLATLIFVYFHHNSNTTFSKRLNSKHLWTFPTSISENNHCAAIVYNYWHRVWFSQYLYIINLPSCLKAHEASAFEGIKK